MLVKVEDSNFFRDTNSMALVNNDNSAKEEYLMKARMMRLQKVEIDRINSEIGELKTDIKDIKSILLQILADKTNG